MGSRFNSRSIVGKKGFGFGDAGGLDPSVAPGKARQLGHFLLPRPPLAPALQNHLSETIAPSLDYVLASGSGSVGSAGSQADYLG